VVAISVFSTKPTNEGPVVEMKPKQGAHVQMGSVLRHMSRAPWRRALHSLSRAPWRRALHSKKSERQSCSADPELIADPELMILVPSWAGFDQGLSIFWFQIGPEKMQDTMICCSIMSGGM
jgi:hypothetical protein